MPSQTASPTRTGTDAGFAALDPCVHCGFCLPACPTYLATGDENDSPRGRIVLMRALEQGDLAVDDPALVAHLDACLGCRGCEPACPSGVGYGRGLEAARVRLATAHPLPHRARALLGLFARRWAWRPALALARALRNAGAGTAIFHRAFPMLMATAPWRRSGGRSSGAPAEGGETVALFRGCVMDGLFAHVHDATRIALSAAGYRVREVTAQACCGALHAHAGHHDAAVHLARRNLSAFGSQATDYVVTNSAGCGALLKEYADLVQSSTAGDLASRVRDVAELVAGRIEWGQARLDPAPSPLLRVAYDAPCHLQHAQGVHADVLRMLGEVPGIVLGAVPDSDKCCGSAGIYALLQPGLSRQVLGAKVEAIRSMDPPPDVVATGNPGCIIQIGTGLRAAGLSIPVVHPVELVAWALAERTRV